MNWSCRLGFHKYIKTNDGLIIGRKSVMRATDYKCVRCGLEKTDLR